MLFRDAVATALAEMATELKPTSLPTWRSHAKGALAYWGEERDLTTLTRLEVQAWINWRAKKVKTSTIGHERSFLSRLWRVLEDRGLDAGLQCPLLRLRMPKRLVDKRKITLEVVKLLEASLSSEDWDLVNLTLLTFLRRLEVFRLEACHLIESHEVDEAGRPVVVYKLRIVTSKTGRARVVPLSAPAVTIVKRRIEEAEKAGRKHLFGGQGENRFAAACAWDKSVWAPAIKKIGKGGQFHGLRHLGAHTAWKNGAPIEAISKMLGHSTIAQTEHYIGVTEDSMWAAAHAAAGRAAIDPPPIPRPGLVDPIPPAPLPSPPVIPDQPPEREPQPTRNTDWIFSM